MPLSYKNLLNVVTSEGSNVSRKSLRTAKYIKGYVDNTAIEALANSLNINKGLFKQVFGLEDKELDAYDPYHTSDAKGEEFWLDSNNNEIDGKRVQSEYDEDTNTFKRGLYSNPELGGYGQTDFWHEDPFIPNFELFFDDESPLFNGDDQFLTQSPYNTIKNFMQRYEGIDSSEYQDRFNLWVEFKKIFFKIFEKELRGGDGRNRTNKAYYISKIGGLNNLNKKMIKYGEDKITITMNEDVSMIAWYLAELYKNLVYSYKNQRFAFPENAVRFNMTIKINEMRNYQIPQSNNNSSPNIPKNDNYLDNVKIKNTISPKSEIFYTLYDCTFDFFESRNYNDELERGGYGVGAATTPQTLSFDIYFKSVTHHSNFPLIVNSLSINPWEDYLYDSNIKQDYLNTLATIKQETKPEPKGYLNQLLNKAGQTVINQGLNYLDNLETKLREVRGSAVNDLLLQFRDLTQINKIEPDNVYNINFNDRTNLGNFGRSLGSSLLNDLEDTIRNAANF